MRKRFIENLAFFITLNLLVKPIYVFGIDRVVQNTVGTVNYGTYFPLLNFVLIFQIFLDLGIENYTRKELAQNPILQSRLFSGFVVIKLLLILLFLISFAFIGIILPHSQFEWKLLMLLVVNQSMASLILYMRANMGGLHLFKAEGIISVLDRLFMIVICGVLLLNPVSKSAFKIEWFVLAQTIAYLLTLITAFVFVYRNTTIVKLKTKRITYLLILRSLKPYAILALLMAFYYRIDSVFLRYFIPNGKEQAGIYAHGFRIFDFLSNYAFIFSLILLPVFSTMIKRKENVAPLLRLSALILIIPSSAILISIAYYRFDVFQILYPGSGALSANVFLILIISFIGMCVNYTFGALLTANGNLKQLIHMAIITVIISTVLNILLIPHLKAMGSAIANATSQFFTIIYQFIIAKRKLKLDINKSLIQKTLIFYSCTIIFGFIYSHYISNWVIGAGLILITSLIFAYTIRLLKVSIFVHFVRDYISNKDLSTTTD